jgi:hypothetical protein
MVWRPRGIGVAAIQANLIRVYFNRPHDDDGLRIDHTDVTEPVIRSGRIGLQASDGGAWFGNVIVLPIEALPRVNPE